MDNETLELLESVTLTMANHGDAYRNMVWPLELPKSDNEWSAYLVVDCSDVSRELMKEARKHHRCTCEELLYLASHGVIKQWTVDYFAN